MNNMLRAMGDVVDSLKDNPDIQGGSIGGVVQPIILTVVSIAGIIAVIMIILGGVKYSVSQGDAGKVKSAKDTIMYGIIGLLVATLAFAIVNFVMDGVFGPDPTPVQEEKGDEDGGS